MGSDRDKLLLGGRPWLGANSWSRARGPRMWPSYDPAVVTEELATLAAHGIVDPIEDEEVVVSGQADTEVTVKPAVQGRLADLHTGQPAEEVTLDAFGVRVLRRLPPTQAGPL